MIPKSSVPSAAVRPSRRSVPPRDPADLQLAPKIDVQSGELAWEGYVARVLENPDLTDSAKAQHLLAALTALPEESLETVAGEAVARLPDADYAAALGALLNPQTHGAILSVLFADLLERPDAITLPSLLAIARNPGHPFAPSAAANLELLLEANYGSDWTRWDAEIRAALSGEAATTSSF